MQPKTYTTYEEWWYWLVAKRGFARMKLHKMTFEQRKAWMQHTYDGPLLHPSEHPFK